MKHKWELLRPGLISCTLEVCKICGQYQDRVGVFSSCPGPPISQKESKTKIEYWNTGVLVLSKPYYKENKS